MDTDPDLKMRVGLVESRLDHIDKSLGGLNEILKELRTSLATHRNPIPFKEIAASIAITLGIVATLGTFANYWHTQANAVASYRIEQLEHAVAKLPR